MGTRRAKTIHPAEIADTTIAWIEPEDRSHPSDEFLVAKEGATGWLVTRKDVATFRDQLNRILDQTDHRLDAYGDHASAKGDGS